MRITDVRAIHFATAPNVTFVEIETDSGLIGLGETYYTPQTVTTYLREVLAPQLLEVDSLQIEALWRRCYDGSHVYGNKGLEMRCLSAIDIALWDILGQASGQPVWQLLGGTSHPDGVLVYNTCASSGYAQGTPGIPRVTRDTMRSRQFQDYEAWQKDADAGILAKSLLDMGIGGMKIWPFDAFALTNRGQSISAGELDEGLRPWKQIRDAVGMEMAIILEGHGYWALEPARTIANALEPYQPALLEDLIKPDHLGTLAQLRRCTSIPLCGSELLMTRYGVGALLDAEACDVIMTDVSWAGGITECRKIANMADTANLGIIFHDCTGPVALAAALHLSVHCTNTWRQEIVRAYTYGYYRNLVDHAFEVTADGRMLAPDKPGLGVKLNLAARQRPDCDIQSVADRRKR